MDSQSNSTPVPTVQIGEVEIAKIEYRGQQVVTFAMIDQVHKRPKDTAKRSFDENRERFVSGEDFFELGRDEIRTNLPEGVLSKYAPKAHLVTKRGYLKIAKTLGDDRAWEVFDEMVERYFAVEKMTMGAALPDFTNPIVAARAWADQVEGRQIAERTKAQIGSRREATAMASASASARKVRALEIELDRSQEYATVKRMEKHHGRKFPWRPLKKYSLEAGIEIKDVPDANYDKVNSYHADVWRAVYQVEIPAADEGE